MTRRYQRKPHISVWFDTGKDFEYEVPLDSFSPARWGSYEEAPEGSEVEPAAFVKVHYTADRFEVITWETFLVDYAIAKRLPLVVAEERIMDKLHKDATDAVLDSLD